MRWHLTLIAPRTRTDRAQDLDEHGIAHRDIKPDNIGVRLPGKKKYQLCLFDFSLSKTSPDDIKVGTHAYLDPFISERKVKRWDVSCELFSVAVTLHEMTTGVLPQWGDGRSDPASIKNEVTIRPELFDPDLRERFVPFFEKALKRDYRDRFDNPEAMLKAWHWSLDISEMSKWAPTDPRFVFTWGAGLPDRLIGPR
jgi:serine/threonine protein kinase